MSRTGTLVSPILVGRDDLLELADRRIAEVLGGRGQFLLLSGEAGVGKTRLLGPATITAPAGVAADADGSDPDAEGLGDRRLGPPVATIARDARAPGRDR